MKRISLSILAMSIVGAFALGGACGDDTTTPADGSTTDTRADGAGDGAGGTGGTGGTAGTGGTGGTGGTAGTGGTGGTGGTDAGTDATPADGMAGETAPVKFKLTLNLMNFGGPHSGKKLELFVRQGTTTVGMNTLPSIPATGVATVEVLNVLEAGMTYTAEFYADHNGNGMCDAPPTDHSWILPIASVTGDTVLMKPHSTNDWMEVCP